MSKQPDLRRYTELPSLLYLLQSKALTLLSPKKWDDRNDAYYLEKYKDRKGVATLLALCFTEASETYHHWRVFAGGTSGVCLVFDGVLLKASMEANHGVKVRPVKYMKIKELRDQAPKVSDPPFLKRYPFRDEKEIRIIYEGKEEDADIKNFAFNPCALKKVVVNPWMPMPVYKSVKDLICAIDGWEKLTVNRTTLVDNEEWKRLGGGDRGASRVL